MKDEFVMVPRVPTDEMIVAFAEAWYSKRQCIDDPDMLDAYAAMLAVAPEYQGEPYGCMMHPINMKALMQAYEQVDHRVLLHGTSNWCAAMATALRGVLCADPSAPVEIDEQAEFMAWANEEYQVGADEELNLKNPNVRDNKIGWLARAALERKS